MKRMLQGLSLSILLGAAPIAGQEPAPPKKAVVIPEGLGAPVAAPDLPASFESKPVEAKKGTIDSDGLKRDEASGASVTVETKDVALVPSKRLPAAKPPQANLAPPPKDESPEGEGEDNAPTHQVLLPAEGVVLGKSGTMVTLMGQVGSPTHYVLPKHAYLVNIAGGGLTPTDSIGVGDFIALIGPERGTGRVLFAHLPMGKQPNQDFDELDDTIKACYERAVVHLEGKGDRSEAGGDAGAQ